MKKLIILIMGVVILFSQAKTFAVPPVEGTFLGVASDTGIYAYSGSTPPTDKWIEYFATTLVPSGTDMHGFVIGQSGTYLTVFTSYNPSTTPIWLLANTGPDNIASDPLAITFGGSYLNSMGDIGQIDGYLQEPYYGTPLSKVLSDWETVNDTYYFPKTTYKYKRQIIYADGFDPEDYFFACADSNGTEGLQFKEGGKPDDFSPKTASTCDETTKIPEPATTALLGLGLIGFVGKIIKKKR